MRFTSRIAVTCGSFYGRLQHALRTHVTYLRRNSRIRRSLCGLARNASASFLGRFQTENERSFVRNYQAHLPCLPLIYRKHHENSLWSHSLRVVSSAPWFSITLCTHNLVDAIQECYVIGQIVRFACHRPLLTGSLVSTQHRNSDYRSSIAAAELSVSFMRLLRTEITGRSQ